MKNRAIVPAFVAVSLIYAVCVSNVPAVELLSRMTSKLGKVEAKCGAEVQKSAKQKGDAAAKKSHLNVLRGLVSQIQKSIEPKSGGKAKASSKKKSAAQKSAKKKSAAQKSAKKKSAAQKSAKKKSAAQKSAKRNGHVRNLLDRVVRRMEPKCGCEPQGKSAGAPKNDDATPPPPPAVSNEA